MADLYLEELNNYLRGSEWRESIEVFTTSNCRAFSRIKELSHHHHSIWKNFQEIVEAILDVALESVGGSIETLEKALDEVQHQPSRGPRDDLIKEVISQLLSFDDFESFCTMMNETYTSQVEQASPNDEIFKFDLLINMGFAWDAVNSAIEKGGKDASLDEILEMLSSSNNNSESAVDLQVKVDSYHRKLEIDPNVGALQKFADELSEELQFDHDFNDLNAKFALAESMVDAVQDGVIHQNSLLSAAVEDGELGVEHLMRWANDMKTLREDIQTAYEEQIDSRELCFNCEEGLLVWFRQLEEERLQLDRTALAGTMLSDSECRRMAELDRIAAEVGTEDEQHLHSLISNHDRLTKDIDTLHRKCGVLVAANRNNGVGISRENLEELYLFLKQQVANGLELSFVADELFIKVRSLVGEHTDNRASGETINLLLDLHVLEDELIMLKQQIQHLVGGSPMRPVDQPSLEEPTIDSSINELHLFLNEIDLNGLPSEYKADDKMATVRPIESKGYGDYSPNQGFSNQSSLTADAKNKDTSSNEVSQGERFQGVGVSAGGEFKSSDAANTGDRKGKERSLENPELIQLKSQHQDALKSLQSSLAADRSNRLRQLEDRLLRRKAAVLQHKQKMQQGGEEYDTVGNMLQAELDDIIVELEKEQHQGEVRSNAIISGFKRKCVGEMGVLKKNLKNNSEYSTQNASDDAGKREAQLAAATALKKRYALESDQLAASFDLQKRQQRLKLEQMLARKRQQISDRIGSKHDSKSDSDLSIEEEKVIQQMVEIEKDLQNQQEMAMKNAQESLLLSLSAVYLEEDTLKTITKREEEDVDNYLEDSSDMENTVLRQWIDRVTGMTSAYVESADEIQTQLRSQGRESSATSALVTDLVAGAFENQLTNPFFAPQSLSGTRKGFGGVGKGFGGSVSGFDVQRKVDRNAARASILDEFVKAKKEQEELFALKQNTGKDKLRAKLGKKKQMKEEVEGKEEDKEGFELKEELQMLEQAFTTALNPDDSGFDNSNNMENKTINGIKLEGKGSNLGSKRFDNGLDLSDVENEKMRAIKLSHQEKEKKLVDELHANMMNKKKLLEERLKKRKHELENQDASKRIALDSSSMDDVANVEEEVKRLEMAFEQVKLLLSKNNVPNNWDITQLMQLMEKINSGAIDPSRLNSLENLPTLTTIPSVAPNKTLEQMKASEKQQKQHEIEEKERKKVMETEAKRISLAYNEEQQKLDLMMKIQQTRQRQALQRKLFERSQARAHQQQEYQNDDDDTSVISANHISPAQQASGAGINIGSRNSLLQRMASERQKQQPTVKGLGPYAVSLAAAVGVRQHDRKSMANRGLNLTPMLRK